MAALFGATTVRPRKATIGSRRGGVDGGRIGRRSGPLRRRSDRRAIPMRVRACGRSPHDLRFERYAWRRRCEPNHFAFFLQKKKR